MRLEEFVEGYTRIRSGAIDWDRVEEGKLKLRRSLARLGGLAPGKRREVLGRIGEGFLGISGVKVFEGNDLLAAVLHTLVEEICRYGLAQDLASLVRRLEERAGALEAAARETEEWLVQRREEHPTWAPGVTEVLLGLLKEAQRAVEGAIARENTRR